MKLSLILEAVDKATRPLARVAGSMGALDRRATTAARGVGALDRQLDRGAGAATRFNRATSRIGGGIAAGARRGVQALVSFERRMQFSQSRMEKFAYSTGSLIGSTIRGGLIAAGTAGIGAATAGIWKSVTAGMQFEKYRTQLTGLEGSRAGGERAMDWVANFAKETPYEIGEVMEAFVALKAYGIDPTDGSLRTLGDTAAGMGKSLMQAVEMIADAQTGEFERLKEFGIRAKVNGDQVTLSFRKNGKEIQRTVKNTASEIQKALGTAFNDRFAGGMAALAKTTEGKWSGLMDRLTFSAKRVWEGGFGDAVNRQLDRMSSALDKAEQDGSLKRWAESTGKGIGDFIDTMARADWAQIGSDLSGIAGAINKVARALEWLDRARKGVGDFQKKAESWGNVLGSVSLAPQGGLIYHAPNWTKPAPPRKPAPARKAPASGNGVPFFSAAQPQQAAPAKEKVEVAVSFKDAPAGTRTRVSSSSGVNASSRVSYRGQANAGPA